MTPDERTLLIEMAKAVFVQCGMPMTAGLISGKPLLEAIKKLDPSFEFEFDRKSKR
jgi:hypothetical protein